MPAAVRRPEPSGPGRSQRARELVLAPAPTSPAASRGWPRSTRAGRRPRPTAAGPAARARCSRGPAAALPREAFCRSRPGGPSACRCRCRRQGGRRDPRDPSRSPPVLRGSRDSTRLLRGEQRLQPAARRRRRRSGSAASRPRPASASRQLAEGDRAARLADDQLRRGGVDRAAGAQAEHPVEAAGGDVGGGDRDRADDAQPVDLALPAPRATGSAQLGLRRLEPDELELLASSGATSSGSPSSVAPSPRAATNSSPAPKS